MDEVILVDDYPELSLLTWSRAKREISPQEALALYERNWRFVDRAKMADGEAALIQRLVAQYGKGFCMHWRPSHNAVLAALQALDAGFLADSKCYLGGGTAAVLMLGEYREPAGIRLRPGQKAFV